MLHERHLAAGAAPTGALKPCARAVPEAGAALASTVKELHLAADECRRALLTCILALYPLIGSVTIILAALLLAGGDRLT